MLLAQSISLVIVCLVGNAVSLKIGFPLKIFKQTAAIQQFRQAGFAVAAGLLLSNSALASDSHRVGEIPTSGLIFKDTLDITSFSDPKVAGVCSWSGYCFLWIHWWTPPFEGDALCFRLLKANHRKNARRFFQWPFHGSRFIYDDPHWALFFKALTKWTSPIQASITCVKDGPIRLAEGVAKGREGEEVFSEAKSLLFKSVKVRRLVDEVSHNVVYVSYSQKTFSNDDSNKSRYCIS